MKPVEHHQPPPHTSHESVQIIKVEGRRALNEFIRLPWSLYRDDPMWVPPLMMERREHLSPKNPYFKHASYCSWLAYRDSRPVGRISAQKDSLYLDRYRNATGFFGMLEAEDNTRTFQTLLGKAESWLRNQGMQRISGPFNLSVNQELGLLVDGFDTPPSLMMGHARPYYGSRLEENGYAKEKDLLAYLSYMDFKPSAAMQSVTRHEKGEKRCAHPVDSKIQF